MKLMKNMMMAMIIGGAVILLIDELSKAQPTDEKNLENVEILEIDAEEVENKDEK